jgi:hypothetical protein
MRKGQAAMEFLMTYGWAILVVLIAIGALAYFGVLSPDKLLPNQCRLAQGLYCKSHLATTSGASVLIVNSLGKDITVTDINLSGVAGCEESFSTALANDAQAQFDIPCAITAGSKVKSDIVVTYDEVGGLSGIKNAGLFVAQSQ